MTPDLQYLHDERISICLAEGISEARAEEIAREQIEGKQPELFGEQA